MPSGHSGNAERYLYERLQEKRFQQLCNALLVRENPDIACFPVGQKDGGRDALLRKRGKPNVVYQVKWTKRAPTDPVSWLTRAIEGEKENIERLISEGARSYVLMTCVAGTSARGSGSMDKLDVKLAKYAETFGIAMRCWWRADIDARVEAAPRELVWSYAEMLAGVDAVRYVIEADQHAVADQQLRQLLLAVIATQWDEDSKIKFRQVELDTYNLLDLYVDVEAVRTAKPRNASTPIVILDPHVTASLPPSPRAPVALRARVAPETEQEHALGGAAQYLLNAAQPLTLVRGEPGQGKSTLAQYVCQRHRAAFLRASAYLAGTGDVPAAESPRLPLRVDLRDYARWCSGEDPFAEDQPGPSRRVRRRAQPTLEKFLAHLLTARGTGVEVSVETVTDVLTRFPMLIVLDGLDEVAHRETRTRTVRDIDQFVARLGAGVAAPQVIVTTRPNSSGLAEPSPDTFETIALVPLSPELRTAYLRKWADARGLRGKNRRTLETTFKQRSIEPHIAQLADNPMQLTILLYLIQKRGESVPDGRTQLFTAYMDTFLDRESEKSPSVHEHREDLVEVTAFLGWHLQARTETDDSAGRAPTKAIRRAILTYLHDVEKDTTLVDELFTAVTDRVWALSSKTQGTFEFDIQTMREYFAALYLWGFAGADLRNFDKSAILGELVRRSYWLNTARFFAGFADPNELAGLVDVLEEEFETHTRPYEVRMAAWTLLSDGVFAKQTRALKRAARLFVDDLSVRLMQHRLSRPTPPRNAKPLADDRGAEHLISQLEEKVQANPGDAMTGDRMRLILQLGGDPTPWWLHNMATAAGTDRETTWLRCGVPLRRGHKLTPEQTNKLLIATPEDAQLALNAGVTPAPGSDLDQRLTTAVLAGHCSDTDLTAAAGIAGDLVKVLAPERFLAMAARESQEVFRVRTGHRSITNVSYESVRQAAQRRLRERDQRFDLILRAVRVGRGQSGTTSMWSDTAREVASIYGPCWLATEITVIGAAAPDKVWTIGGTVARNGVPFGPDPDYGKLLQEARFGRNDVDWWQSHYDTIADDLSRASWCLALTAVASDHVILANINRLDAATTQLPVDLQRALILSSSRLGASHLTRRLRPNLLQDAGPVSTLTALLIAHYSIQAGFSADVLPGLSDQQLAEMGRFGVAGWPGLYGLSARMRTEPTEQLVAGLRAHGSQAVVALPTAEITGPRPLFLKMLKAPSEYPLAWVLAAESSVARDHQDDPLMMVARAKGWFADVA